MKDLPTADYIVESGINLATTNGKITLTTNNEFPIKADDDNVIDFIDYGLNADTSEGNENAPIPSNTTSLLRKNNGCTDTNNNKNDFETLTISPRNSQSELNVCENLSTTDYNVNNKELIIKNTLVDNSLHIINDGEIKIYNSLGQIVKTAKVNKNTEINVSHLSKGTYIHLSIKIKN
ncbi:T9SS type A sorting domain-containing protein [Chishuiella sp.]|uniref:T9SS type A sorting domain-containing protein n=1 Tax=Chishuiella sp. TaxID=1969467 RepID=UPI0028A7FDC1|nr:T9SS type A sorting domain-containing protein [Chishuiella sp.]